MAAGTRRPPRPQGRQAALDEAMLVKSLHTHKGLQVKFNLCLRFN